MDRFLYVYKKRIDLRDSNRLIILTGSCAEYMKDVKAVCYVNGEKKKVSIIKNPRTSMWFVYKNAQPEFDAEYLFVVELEENTENVALSISKDTYPSGKVDIKLKKRDIELLRENMELTLVTGLRNTGEGQIKINGWTECAGKPDITVLAGNKKLNHDLRFYERADVTARYPEGEIEKDCGFEITLKDTGISKLRIEAQYKNRKNSTDIKLSSPATGEKNRLREKIALNNRTSYIKRAISYIAVFGLKRFLIKVYNKLSGKAMRGCHAYFTTTTPTRNRLNEQREYTFFERPKFSFVIPVYRPNRTYFTQMLESIVNQTYDNWEICLADGGKEIDVKDIVDGYLKKYGDKIRYIKLDENLGIADNTNAAIGLATGEYIVFGDHDDEIHPSALFECMRVLEKDKTVDFIYTDEDKIIEDTKKHVQAHFKPDFNPEFLRHNNYICHLVVVNRELAEITGKLDGRYNGAQDFDYVLRLSEHAKNIYHIPKILYHWRISKNSTAKKATQKSYANDAGKRALVAHFNRMGVKAEVEDGFVPGFYRPVYLLENEPKVSIIIPNKDHVEDLNQCVRSLFEVNTYSNFECIIVENNSECAETFEYYKTIEKEYPDRIKTVFYNGDFNYSEINNLGVSHATGEYILLLNNDTKIKSKDTLKLMVAQCINPGVGAVGAKLLYGDNTIQHAGIVMGYQGVGGHAFVGEFDDNYGYFGHAMSSQEVSAVTAACLLTPKRVYDELGGLDAGFKVAFNDVDYCMRVRKAGYKIIYEADAKLYHFESKSRGADDTADKQVRFFGEVMRFEDRWRDELYRGDCYYNPNMDLIGKLYEIRQIY